MHKEALVPSWLGKLPLALRYASRALKMLAEVAATTPPANERDSMPFTGRFASSRGLPWTRSSGARAPSRRLSPRTRASRWPTRTSCSTGAMHRWAGTRRRSTRHAPSPSTRSWATSSARASSSTTWAFSRTFRAGGTRRSICTNARNTHGQRPATVERVDGDGERRRGPLRSGADGGG